MTNDKERFGQVGYNKLGINIIVQNRTSRKICLQIVSENNNGPPSPPLIAPRILTKKSCKNSNSKHRTGSDKKKQRRTKSDTSKHTRGTTRQAQELLENQVEKNMPKPLENDETSSNETNLEGKKKWDRRYDIQPHCTQMNHDNRADIGSLIAQTWSDRNSSRVLESRLQPEHPTTQYPI